MFNVNVATGELCFAELDISLPGFIRFEVSRVYKGASDTNGAFGWNWNHPFVSTLEAKSGGWVFTTDSNARIPLSPVTSRERQCAPGEPDLLAASEDKQFSLYRQRGEYVLHLPNLRRLHFPAHGAAKSSPLALVDACGNALVFEHDDSGRLRRVTDTHGRRILVSHDRHGRITEFRLLAARDHPGIVLGRYSYEDGCLVSVEDATGHACRFEYDRRLLVRYVNKLGGSWYAQYDDRRRCIRTWNDSGKQTRLDFDDATRTTRLTNSFGFVTVYKLNAAGFVEHETNPLGATKEYVFDSTFSLIATINENGDPQTTTALSSDEARLIVTDAAGAASAFTRDDRGQVIRESDATGAVCAWDYDEFGNLIREVRPSGAESRYEYDARGFLVRTTDALGNVIEQSLSADGSRMDVRDALGTVAKYAYDELGHLVSAVDGADLRLDMHRDFLGKVTEVRLDGRTIATYEYDFEGNLVKQADSLGRVAHWNYDRLGRCLEYTAEGGARLSFEYDLEDNPTAITNELGDVHRIAYDAVGRVVQQVFFDGSNEWYSYDKAGNLTAVTRGDHTSVCVRYDEVGNIVAKEYSDGTREHFAFDGLRRLTSLANDAITINLTWDADGNLTGETQGDRTLEYRYDAAGNLTSLDDGRGRTIGFEWDCRRRPVSVNDSVMGLHRFAYGASGLLIEHRLPNGVVCRDDYDRVQLLKARHAQLADRQAMVTTYQYDATSQLVKSVDAGEGSTTYRYDSRQRLLAVKRDGDVEETYRYDAASNVLYSRTLGAVDYAGGNLLVSTVDGQRRYNDRGGLQLTHDSKGKTLFAYNAAGRLREVRSPDGARTSYTYDALGRRISKTCNGATTNYAWFGFTLLEECRGSDLTRYLYDASRWVPLSQARGEQRDHFLTDFRGCVRAATDEEGRLTGRYNYTAFGRLLDGEANAGPPHPFRLRGQFADGETGLHYNLHRYYEPETGRFLTRDPLGLAAGANMYVFGPNPVNYADLYGLIECEGDVFYRTVNSGRLAQMMADCNLKSKKSACPDVPYISQNREYIENAISEDARKNKGTRKYEHLVEICTQPGTLEAMLKHQHTGLIPGTPAAMFPPEVQALPVARAVVDRIQLKMEKGALTFGLGKGEGLKLFNDRIVKMECPGTGQTCAGPGAAPAAP